MLNSDGNRQAEESRNFNVASDIVELVVFTTDQIFMHTLREAVGDSRRLWHVPSVDKVSDLLLAGQVGILVLDVQSQSDAAGAFVAQIKDQFPDLVIVVAGSREAETSLAKLISDGTVYRFLHKPVSPGRAKLFADAAVKKFEEKRKRAKLPAHSDRIPKIGQRWPHMLASLAATVVVLAGMWTGMRMLKHVPSEASAPPAAPTIPNAPVQGVPAPERPVDPRERLLMQAETALLEERLDDAAAAIEKARSAGVESGRLSFLTSQLTKVREQRKRAAAEASAKGGSRTAPNANENRAKLAQLAAATHRDAAAAQSSAAAQPAAAGPSGAAPQSSAAAGPSGAAPQSSAAAPIVAAQQPGATQQAGAAPQLPQAAENSDADTTVAKTDDQLGAPAAVVDASTLTLVKSTKPVYPMRAETDNIEGWVELEFTVTESGAVKDIAVRASNPQGVFEHAAIGALSRWRYQPVLQGTKSIVQRARIRLRFTLSR